MDKISSSDKPPLAIVRTRVIKIFLNEKSSIKNREKWKINTMNPQYIRKFTNPNLSIVRKSSFP